MRGKRIHRLLSIVLVVVLLLSALPLTALASTDKPADGTTNGQPFSSGTGGSTNFRIPALITLSNGYLLAAADARYSDTGDGYGLDTIVSYSKDNGSTWHYSYVNYFNDSNGYNTNASAFIDPVLVQDKDDTVYLFADLFPGGGKMISNVKTGTGFVPVDDVSYLALYSTANADSSTIPEYYVANELNEDGYYTVYNYNGKTASSYALDPEYNIYEVSGDTYTAVTGTQLDSDTTIQANVFYTGDANPSGLYVLGTQYITMRKGTVNGDGSITWGGLQLLNVKNSNESFYGLGPGGGIVTSTGRIVVPLYTYYYWDGNTSVIYSDDNGKTWKRSADMNVQTSEASISEVTVGGQNYLYMFTRHGGYFVSDDYGETWSDKKNVSGISYTTGCELSTLTYSQLIDGFPAILLSAPTGGGILNDRTNGKIFVGLVQSDSSIDWRYTYNVNGNGTFQYSDLAELPDGSIGLLYESGGAAITYTNLSITEIAKGATIGASEPETPDDNDRVDVTLYVGQSKAYTDKTGNHEHSYTGTGLDRDIATVDVTGKDEQPGSVDYVEASDVSCNDLITEDSNTWLATGYYYTSDGTNYYPVYAIRSSSGFWIWTDYTYNWGYSITDSSTDVSWIKEQSSDNTSTPPNITVYTQSSTEAVPASTTITITGVAPGATSVVVGNTRYNITVNELPPVLDLETTPFVANTGVGDGKKVTKLTTSVGLTFDLDLNRNGSNVVWSVADSSIATVDQNGRVTGRMAGETTVTATIDGVAYTIPVVIRPGATSNYNKKTYDFYLSEVTNTTVYMSISCSPDLIEVQAGEAIYISFNSNADTAVDFFGAPDEGYALTRMSATESAGDYMALNSTNPRDTDFYTKDGAAGKNQRDTFGDKAVADMVQAALDKDCDGGMGFTRPSSNTTSVTSDLTFRSEKLPTVSKEVATVNGVPYTEGMVAHAGEKVVFKVTVTQYASEDEITYSRETLTDRLLGAVFADSQSSTKYINLSDDSVSVDTPYTYDVEYTIKDSDLDKTIINTVDLTYTYKSKYSSGSFESKASADARITAASFEPEDIVIDFGLPVTMDYSGTDAHGRYDLYSGSANYGDVTVDSNKVTYTPKQVLPEADTVTLTNTAGGTYNFKVIPASNVLYEETFLTEATNMGTTYAAWTHSGSAATPAQSADQTSLYGYDDAYQNSKGNSTESAWTISGLTEGNGSKYLTTTFCGNAFDLIGTAGPDTGFVYLMLTGPESKMVIIDTSYVDGNTTLYQVPLAHEELTEGTYTAYIRAAYRAESGGSSDTTSRSAVSTFSLMSASSPLDEVYEVLAEFERDGFVIDDIEFVSVDGNSVLSESADAQVSLFSMPANNTETTAAKSAPARSAGTTVTIDGFRVYRSSSNTAYLDNEQNVTYTNVLDATLHEETFKAYVEHDDTQSWTQENYEASGGPQNEVYLGGSASTNAIAFKVGTSQTTVQISARAVGNETVKLCVNGRDVETISSNTEMYYKVTSNNEGIITIQNTGSGLLALGNLKLPAGISTMALTAADEAVVLTLLRMQSDSEEPEVPVDPGDTEEPEVPVDPETPAVFEPGKLDVKVKSTKVLFNKLVTVTVSASSDVDKLTINGKTLYPTNSLLVKWGLSKTYTYIYVDTVKRNDTKSYEVVAYNADGLASEAVTVQG